MISVVRADRGDSELLAELGKKTFIESHRNSASETDINEYTGQTYSQASFDEELGKENNIYHIINFDGHPAGYSKIIFNSPISECPLQNISKLERIYILQEYYDLKLGSRLYQRNVEIAKKNDQAGMWLYVWTENQRAIHFYKKNGYQTVGSYNFKISKNHFNPNHKMLVLF